jgi:hypothetical protein
MKDRHPAARTRPQPGREARPCPRRFPAREHAARCLHVTVSVPASITVTVAAPAAAWACGPATALAVAITAMTACVALVLLVRLAIASEDRFARFSQMINMLRPHAGSRPPDAPGGRGSPAPPTAVGNAGSGPHGQEEGCS